MYDNFTIVDCYYEDEVLDKMQYILIKNAKNHEEGGFECRMLVTSSVLDIDHKMFNAIQDNGLVYNGRLIVKNNYQTTDPSIFACGKICEFSQRYKNFA